jgi:flavin reductase (DIM6/NTAB) family NADH-FMN oxidoreductase RutF/rubredoxin
MNVHALFNLSSGLYIIGSKDGDKNAGCIVNTVIQSTAKPVTVTVCINKDNYTNQCIKKNGSFSVSILSENTKESTFGLFGFSSSRDKDKFAQVPFALTPSGLPYINEGVCAYLQCKVINTIENFTHTIFIAEVQEAENLLKEPPMTYDYYHKVIKGKAPKTASVYVEEKTSSSYKCLICDYEFPGNKEDFDKLSGSYRCPICGAPKDKFKAL